MNEKPGTRKAELIELGAMHSHLAEMCSALQEENESLRNDVRKLRIIAVGRTKMLRMEEWNKKQAQYLVDRHHDYKDAALHLVYALEHAPWYRKLWWAVSGSWPRIETVDLEGDNDE